MGKGAGASRLPSEMAARLAHSASDPFVQPRLQPHAAMDWEAVRRGDVAAVERSVRERGASVNAVQLRVDGDRMALHTAAIHGHTALVASLLALHADPHVLADCRCSRLAHPVAEGPVSLHPLKGGDRHGTTDVQTAQTPLELALRFGHFETAGLLSFAMGLTRARKPNARDRAREDVAHERLEIAAEIAEDTRRKAALLALREHAGAGAIAAAREGSRPTRQESGTGSVTVPSPPVAPPPPAAAGVAAAGVPVLREARDTLDTLLNPNFLPSWQRRGDAQVGPSPGEHEALFNGLASKQALTEARRREAGRARELRASERDPELLRAAAQGLGGQAPRFERGLSAGGQARSFETGARNLPMDVLMQRALLPVGGVREMDVTRWR
ncbi:hypothetical protein T492DRAFT_1146248 [Pavlovales sp. CCMP2436]|nr:hypothetical protein T492DRAFT_1146248 [Pavlovales sp. CCMP2436]